MPAAKRFDKRITMICTKSDRQMVQDLADADSTVVSDIIRRLIRRAHAEAFPSGAPRRQRKRR